MMMILGVSVSKKEFTRLFEEQAKGKTLMVENGKVVAVDIKVERKIND